MFIFVHLVLFCSMTVIFNKKNPMNKNEWCSFLFIILFNERNEHCSLYTMHNVHFQETRSLTDIVHLCSMHMILNINDHWSICSFVFINVHFCSNLIIYVHFCSICSFWWCYNIFVLLEVSWKWTNWTKVICSFLWSFRSLHSTMNKKEHQWPLFIFVLSGHFCSMTVIFVQLRSFWTKWLHWTKMTFVQWSHFCSICSNFCSFLVIFVQNDQWTKVILFIFEDHC